ncbi:MAG: Gfo/Idh/MocA family oxidoreductase [Anaerolineae bacterium]|nr:Gfo/Idh/MocA family oxidoreductase [Anaerolineae bacterium]
MDTGVLRGAMLGTGTISYHHLVAWQRTPRVKIVALYNRTVEKAYRRADQFGIDRAHVYDDYEKLLDNESLDFVDIATAPALHRVQVEAAAARGIPIICQKPLASSLEDAQAMIDVCDRAGVRLSVNENWRWRSWYREVKRLLDAGRIGKVRYARITAHYNATLPRPDGETPVLFITQAYTQAMPKLILFEWGIHLIDTMRMLFGEVDWVHGYMKRVSPLCAGEDRAFLTLGYGEVMANIDISWASIKQPGLPSVLDNMVIEGDEGTIALVPNQGQGDLISITDWQGSTLLRPGEKPIGSPYRVMVYPAHDGDHAAAYQASYDAAQGHFIDCLRAGAAPETVAADNMKTLAVMFAAYESAERNAVVWL